MDTVSTSRHVFSGGARTFAAGPASLKRRARTLNADLLLESRPGRGAGLKFRIRCNDNVGQDCILQADFNRPPSLRLRIARW